ncbi:TatD family hydrolase [Laribacter hongkongensis]|uniref:TatD family hydrolase n=1 Tax=Laribacter hongkongensis TaxID=168471 RepID=UPI00187892CB|nr:TatD family hydrolase [Laribacter hongkongensis]MBE5529155.1 DNAase [Laribacter hongkongensis]MCG9053087.1 TatD family hydrolase [Laribacter hongkongensis]MCG9077834.1 TatD family hydrolase [Laribacter hongkongensis]MCG9124678.1 TatD family hydrolase [Laribacter hongkongensis]
MDFIDTHCHLDAREFDADRDQAATAARAAGIRQLVVPAVTCAGFSRVRAMREQHGCAVAFGLHPVYLLQHQPADLDRLDEWLTREQPCAVGEIGLDFHLPELDPARQEYLLTEQLRLARRHDLPVILHVRRSVDRVLKCLRQQRIGRGIAHAFNGSTEQAQALIRQGFKLGFGGAMTYSGSQRIRRLATSLPLDSIVLETDAPDIPPAWAPRSEPAFIARYAAELASLRGISIEEVAEATSANARAALNLPAPAPVG